MKIFVIFSLAAIIAFVSAAVDGVPSEVQQEFVGELQDVEGGQIIKIGAYYAEHHDPPGTPSRVDRPEPEGLPSCEFRPSTGDSECSAKCVERLHTGGVCKGKICTCSNPGH